MIQPHTRYGIAAIALVAMLAVLGVGLFLSRGLMQPPNPARLTIATTIFPLADIARNVAGNDVRVIQLLPPGASPHAHILSPQQLADIQNAQTLFVIGHGLDDWASESLRRSGGVPIVTVDSGIQFRLFGESQDEHTEEHVHQEGSIDPHYWLIIPNAEIIATNIAGVLQQLDPEHSQTYADNLAVYISTLQETEQELQQQARNARTKEFIAIHDAWSYMAAHYGFELLATYEPVEGKEPTVSDIQQLQNIISEHGITTFYAEPAEHSLGATRLFEQNLGLSMRALDDIGGVPPRDSYINLMKENITALSQ